MFVNKIASYSNVGFKGYQHETNSVGDAIMRFNYVYDYNTKNANVEFFKVKKNNDAYAGYEVITDAPIARVKLENGGTNVNLDSITNLDRDEAFAYRIVVDGEKPTADTGIKVNNGEYTLVTRSGTAPVVQGAGYLVYPDSQRVGVIYASFDEPNTGEIIIDKKLQKDMEGVKRSFSDKTGGNLAGLEHNLDYLAANGYVVQPANPIAGGDNKAGHHYWNKNNFQISDDMGNAENFNSYVRKLFQKGMVYVYDGTFTSEGLEGIHFQYAMRWAGQNPQTYYWFKMQGLKDQPLGLGVVPRHAENLQHRVINAPVIYNESTKKIENNPNYNPNKETLFQIYDGSLVSDEQLAKLDKPIENYEKIKSDNFLAINSHDDTIINYVCEIKPEEYKDRLNSFIEFNKKTDSPMALNSSDGTVYIGQFSNFKIDRKTEGGFVAWDANTDMAKMNYQNSGYDEKINMSNINLAHRDYDKIMRTIGAFEVQDMTLQVAKYRTRDVAQTQTIYSAQVLKGVTSVEQLKELIDKGLLPKKALVDQQTINNIINGYYKLEPKGILDKDDTTIKALMQLPLDALEFAENTVGVLSTSYFSNRATSKDTLGMTRFELMKKDNPHLLNEYAQTYLKTNLLFSGDIKNFADEVIKKVNETSSEKLLDANGDYTEYGEYVIELMGQSIAKYALLKSLTGDSLKTKILPNGEVTYDYRDIKDKTSLKFLGINASGPKDEAQKLLGLIEKGLNRLNNSDVDYLAKSISTRISNTNLNSFRLGEALSKKSGLGLAWRLDAGKDLMDQDAGRNGDVAFDENWQKLIDFWKLFVQTVKTENPHSYIVAELTDIAEVMRDNLGENAGCYENMPETGLKFKSVPDALIKFFNETGITSEAGYSYFFTDLMKVFGPEFEKGTINTESWRANGFIGKIYELINTRGVDFIRNLYTFVGNHDKPRILHGLALDMALFHGNLSVQDDNGNFNYAQNRDVRIKSMIQLANADNYESLPLEAKLNIDNPDYFQTVSTYAASMSQLLRDCINDFKSGFVTDIEMKYLKSALVDLTNGNYIGNGSTVQIPSINIPELSNVEKALKAMLQMAGITISQAEFDAIIKRSNDPALVEQFYVQGDFDWNNEIGQRNQKMVETVLRGPYEDVPSGEWDYKKYSTYTVGVAGLLRQAFIDVKGKDANARYQFLKASKDFVQKYDRNTVESARTKLPFYESSAISMAKNNYGAHDIKTAVEMMIAQAEYNARKDGVLGINEHFKNADKIALQAWRNGTEPALQKEAMLYSFLNALVGIPTVFGGDELGMSGYDEKAKNIYLKCRNPLPWSELEEGVFKEYREKILKLINEAFSIRGRDGVMALNNGTPYAVRTSDERIPAFMMQDGYGNMTVSVFNATGVNPNSRFDYFKHLGITDKNRDSFFAKNKIESFNKDNRFVPIQANKDIDYIELAAGLSLPVGLMFMNSDLRDKTTYVVKKVGDKFRIMNKNGGKISLNGLTAKNGAMVLKHVSEAGRRVVFRGSSQTLNKQYNIVSNPYQKINTPVEGEKLSIIAK